MKPPKENFLADAILSLSPTTKEFNIEGETYEDIIFISECSLTKKQIEDEAKRLEDIYDNENWKRSRQKEYPNLVDCIHALLDGGDSLIDLQAERDVIKKKYPKG